MGVSAAVSAFLCCFLDTRSLSPALFDVGAEYAKEENKGEMVERAYAVPQNDPSTAGSATGPSSQVGNEVALIISDDQSK